MSTPGALRASALPSRRLLHVIVRCPSWSRSYGWIGVGLPNANPNRLPYWQVDVLHVESMPKSYMDAALECAFDIHLHQPPGDILVFLTGQQEIEKACRKLNEMVCSLPAGSCGDLVVLPVYAALPPELQARVFAPAPPGCRRCIVATNIAETSITVDGVVYVIDPGFVKQKAGPSCLWPLLGVKSRPVPFRGRNRLQPSHAELQPEDCHGQPGRHGHLQSPGNAASGPRRPDQARQVLPSLPEKVLREGDARDDQVREAGRCSGV